MGILSKCEQEICITKTANEDVFSIYISDPKYIRRMEKINVEPYKKEMLDGEIIGAYYKLDAKLISFKKKRVLTEEEKRMLSERMKKNLNKISSNK